MKMSKTFSTLAVASFLVTSAFSQTKIETVLYFQGAEAGVNKYEIAADGTFKSDTKMNLAGTAIDQVMEGKLVDSKFVTLKVVTKQGKANVVLTWDGDKVKVNTDGKERDLPVKLDPPYFTNFHLQISQGIFKKIDFAKKSAQKVKILIIDSVTPLEITLTPTKTKKILVSGKLEDVDFYNLQLATVEGEYAVAKNGTVLGFNVPAQKFKQVVRGAEAIFEDPIAKFPELSQATFEVAKEQVVSIPMRDGVTTAATVFVPKAPGKYPVILSRTPYDRKGVAAEGPYWAGRGYVWVAQDVRGTGESKGEWDPFVHETKDGYDTIDWISKQPWCDGNVGMIGASYGGLVQWAAAVEQHPALKCIIPQVSPPASAMMNLPYDNGVLMLMSDLWWLRIVDNPAGLNMAGAMGAIKGAKELPTLPLSKTDDKVLGFNSKIFDKWLEREGEDAWPGWSFSAKMKDVKIPALHISGWWDGDGIGTKTNYASLVKAGNKEQWLIYGPWPHNFNSSTKLGSTDFGPTAVLELDSLYIRWFDTWLKGKSVGLAKVPKAKFFVTGANKWVEGDQWPLSTSKVKSFLFDFDKDSTGSTSKAKLVSKLERPGTATFTYDPAIAEVPKQLTEDLKDAIDSAKKKDLKADQVYLETETLTKATALSGPLTVEFSFESNAKDTDFLAILFDVAPDGTLNPIGQPGKIRASYLSGLDKPRPITPGKVYRTKFDLWDCAHEFPKGHKIALMISSNGFPAYARNMGTGEPIKEATKMVKQTNTIFSDPKNPAKLTVRVLW